MTKKTVIVGGGFAGLNLAKKQSNDRQFEVSLIDVNNYHFFPPLLYQVSTAFIEPSNISYPFRKLFQDRKNLRFHMGKLTRIIPQTNTIETDSGSLNYDYLVLAMGTETNFFGNENIRQYALPMKTIDDALDIRNHIHQKSFKGFFAWFAWLFVHIIPLIGFRNKLKIVSNWYWSFITNDPTLRLIIRANGKENEPTNTHPTLIEIHEKR